MHTSPRETNLLGALGIVLSDALDDAAELAGGASPAAALVALHGTSAGGSIDALARRIGLSHSGTVRLVDRLTREGLVERRRGGDQRSTALVLTPQGRRAARRMLSRREANLRSLASLLTGDQRSALAELADALASLPRPVPVHLRLVFGDAGGLLEGLADLPVDGVGVDFYATSLDAVPTDFPKQVLAGVVDARSSALEEPEDVARFAETLRGRGVADIDLVPNGDLQFVPEAIARRKLTVLGRAAALIREEALAQ